MQWHASCVDARVDPQRVLFAMLVTLGALAVAMRFSEGEDTGASREALPEQNVPLPIAAPEPARHEVSLARECEMDCLSVEAGYRWAAARGIEHAEQCSGHSEAFSDGCNAYAKEREERSGDAPVAGERRPAVYVSLGDEPFQAHETLRR